MVLAAARLEQLAQRGDAASLVLWAEASDTLAPLAGVASPLAQLQRVFLLLGAGDTGAAEAEFEALPTALPQGLAGCREELLAAVSAALKGKVAVQYGETATSSAGPLSGLGQENGESGAPAIPLATWLTRVQGWRGALGV